MPVWYLEEMYLKNALRKSGGLEMNGIKIDISKITSHCFILATKDHHIAP